MRNRCKQGPHTNNNGKTAEHHWAADSRHAEQSGMLQDNAPRLPSLGKRFATLLDAIAVPRSPTEVCAQDDCPGFSNGVYPVGVDISRQQRHCPPCALLHQSGASAGLGTGRCRCSSPHKLTGRSQHLPGQPAQQQQYKPGRSKGTARLKTPFQDYPS